MNLNDEVYAYYSKKILDVGFSLFYKDFFETNEFVGQHVDRDKELSGGARKVYQPSEEFSTSFCPNRVLRGSCRSCRHRRCHGRSCL